MYLSFKRALTYSIDQLYFYGLCSTPSKQPKWSLVTLLIQIAYPPTHLHQVGKPFTQKNFARVKLSNINAYSRAVSTKDYKAINYFSLKLVHHSSSRQETQLTSIQVPTRLFSSIYPTLWPWNAKPSATTQYHRCPKIHPSFSLPYPSHLILAIGRKILWFLAPHNLLPTF